MELLKQDHEMVKQLFSSISQSSEKEQDDEEIFDQIRSALEIHAMIEEEIFYPAVAQAQSKQAKEEVQEAKREHTQVKKLLGEMENLEPEDENWEMKLKELQQDVEHHVREEEGELFPEARKVLPQDELTRLGEQLAARKQELEKSMGMENQGAEQRAHSSSK
jgi:iron-sulfur cluster repair protein YtfE (RIC family)